MRWLMTEQDKTNGKDDDKTVAKGSVKTVAKNNGKLAMVIVTFKRQGLLQELFDSIVHLTVKPWRIVVVDNENSPETKGICQRLEADLAAVRRPEDPDSVDAKEGRDHVVYLPLTTNTGGAGGFYSGTKEAYRRGAEWFWLMDDDVAALPESLEKLDPWMGKYEAIQGGRYDFDGGDFYWQYQTITFLGVPNPFSPPAFGPARFHHMNSMCFEGGLFKRTVVDKIGFPDPRFFIAWDDANYGYLASTVTRPIIIEDKVLRRTREMANLEIAGLPQINSMSDVKRYYLMRNRGFLARYYMAHGDYYPFGFALGNLITFIKEIIRLVTVDRKSIRSGLVEICKGWRAEHKILRDKAWQPMPSPLVDQDFPQDFPQNFSGR